ncbi:MAG TPA: peptidase M14 [Clostridiales bacterium]|nr:MAG: peptidase M14 [Clostridiales bacterium GWD2_32_59]HAN10078.1 peptidase M14 [Clostridiales bacterium]
MQTIRYGNRNNDVKILQSVLNKIGYGPLVVDGVFSDRTLAAVKRFQTNYGLVPDGIVGPKTWQVLEKYLLGYSEYVIKAGDTFSGIAKKFHTTIPFIEAANPTLVPTRLQIGQRIIVPYGMDVILDNVGYTYEVLDYNIRGLRARYPFIGLEVPGKSVLGRNLYVLKIGDGPNKVFYNASHHALEWITTPLLMKWLENVAEGYVMNSSIKGYNIREIYRKSTIYIMPMVNPDGVELVINGLKPTNPNYQELIRWNNGSTDFSKTWEANNRGVDPNHNYNAGWEEYQQVQRELGITGPAPSKYSGPFPESEPESKTTADFTRRVNPRLVLAYHSQGEVIYWDFMNMATEEARRIGDMLARVSGYTLETTYGSASYTGYKDWFIKEYRRPGYTIEVGSGVNPLPITQLPKIYNDNEELLLLAAVV